MISTGGGAAGGMGAIGNLSENGESGEVIIIDNEESRATVYGYTGIDQTHVF